MGHRVVLQNYVLLRGRGSANEKQCILPIVGWEAAANIMDRWLVVVTVQLRPQELHPAVFELVTLLSATEEVNSRLQAQEEVQQDNHMFLSKTSRFHMFCSNFSRVCMFFNDDCSRLVLKSTQTGVLPI